MDGDRHHRGAGPALRCIARDDVAADGTPWSVLDLLVVRRCRYGSDLAVQLARSSVRGPERAGLAYEDLASYSSESTTTAAYRPRACRATR